MLISLIISILVIALVYWLVSLIPLPEPFGQIIRVIFIIIAVLTILQAFGVLGGHLVFPLIK